MAAVVAAASPAAAQEATGAEPQLKAAFLFNFLKFIEWPELLATGPLTVCVVGSPAVAQAIRVATQHQRDQIRDVQVVELAPVSVPKLCNLVYVADASEQSARRWLAVLSGSPAFSVSDCELFARLGGVANFFVQGGRLRFAVNVDAARRAGLRISSRMLSLATIVRDESALPQ